MVLEIQSERLDPELFETTLTLAVISTSQSHKRSEYNKKKKVVQVLRGDNPCVNQSVVMIHWASVHDYQIEADEAMTS